MHDYLTDCADRYDGVAIWQLPRMDDGGLMAGSPLSRRIRLGRALEKLRVEHGDTLASLAARADVSTSVLSRMLNPTENVARKPTMLAVRKLLDALNVERGGDLWQELDACAEDGAQAGWWDKSTYARMGERQKTFAVAEFGAAAVLDYGASLLPGPIQTADYARFRAQVGTDGQGVDVEAIVAGRMRRQQAILNGSTRYEVVLEEQTVRRYPVPPPVMLDQLHHLLELTNRPGVSIRLLRVDAQVANGCGAAPRTPFAHYSYPDADDPKIVTVDTVTADLLVTDVDEVDGYARLHDRLRRAALSDADSADLIREVAGKLAASV